MGPTDVTIYCDKKRTPKYYVTSADSRVLFESDDIDKVVKWTVDNYTYSFSIAFPYTPKYR